VKLHKAWSSANKAYSLFDKIKEKENSILQVRNENTLNLILA
jgi:hypothetical protein